MNSPSNNLLVRGQVGSSVPFSQPWGGAADAADAAARRDYGALFGGLAAGVTGKTVGGRYTGKQPEAAAAAQ